MKKRYIMIGHKKKQGKDTFAKMLKEVMGDAEIFSFADPMREIMAELYGVTVDEYKEAYNEDEMLRDVLKIFGNGKMVEYFGQTVWRDLLIKRAEESDAEWIIVPDFRFLREQIEGATMINVIRDTGDGDEHQSETELDSFEYEITMHNNGNLQELANTVHSVVGYIITKDVPLREDVPTHVPEQHDDVFDTFNYFKLFSDGGFVPEVRDIDYDNLLKDDEHVENMHKVYDAPEAGEVHAVGKIYFNETYVGEGTLIFKLD